ncbi:Alpha-ketoglutarate-dependent dioxygenase alkB-like protein [Lachnellula suecica]|uniref:Alpha-ketoglutarate-dependent dioxygenase alkB-like protein n=1 Tax=Lachnellula suecica TaxID=602035 RepID=A0A8T9CGW8_9HELO|nr:Alpha-ketoglutarate-dependent dioxygenase alkB-like protein [Lachnellula suecica]
MAVSSLEEARVKGLPSSAFYIADFITEEEEQMLLSKIATAPKPRWKQLAHRRIQVWPSDLSKNNTLLDSSLPNWLVDPIISRMQSLPISTTDPQSHIFSDSPHGAPNLVLINEYQPGEGIMPHKDGVAYHPVVCTVSLGSSLTLGIHGKNESGSTESEPRWRILQEPRSLLITTGELYTDFLHGIAEITEDVSLSPDTVSNWDLLRSPDRIIDGRHQRETRTSLTYRDVLKVTKLGSKFGALGKR